MTAVSQRDTIVSLARPVANTITWQPFGPMAGLRHAHAGIDMAWTYDQDGRLGRILATGGTGTPTTFLDLTYTWDNADNVTAIADSRVPAQNQSFGYDALDRLTGSVGAYGDWSFGYDANGNRTTRARVGGPSESYGTTSGTNRLASVSAGTSSRTLGYDGNGAITADSRGAGQDFTYLYDSAGRLIEVQRAGQTWARYALNATGERVAKTIPGTPDQVTHFHYDLQGRLIAETDAAGAVLREYFWLDDLPLMARIDGTEYTILADHLGTPQHLVDAAGNAAWDAVWRPFGEIDSLTTNIVFPLRLPGQYFDAETGLHYNYMRDYDPALGRYIQADPIGLTGGANRYAYVAGNPISLVDPSGLFPMRDMPLPPSPSRDSSGENCAPNAQSEPGQTRSGPQEPIQLVQSLSPMGTLVTSWKTPGMNVMAVYNFGGAQILVPLGQRIAPPYMSLTNPSVQSGRILNDNRR